MVVVVVVVEPWDHGSQNRIIPYLTNHLVTDETIVSVVDRDFGRKSPDAPALGLALRTPYPSSGINVGYNFTTS